jgi:DNA-binding NtrC family response regulator
MAVAIGSEIDVLHVDDEPDFAELAAEFLKRHDQRFMVETSSSVKAGLERLAHNGGFDCIISDYDMPGQNGIEFLKAIRELHPDLPFILFTGKGSEEIASEAISAGVTDYLQKEAGTDQYAVLANRARNAVLRYRAERDAERTQARLEAIAENSSDVIVTIDPESRIRFANGTAEEVFG